MFIYILVSMYRKGVLPDAGSPTATLLRLHISHSTYSNVLNKQRQKKNVLKSVQMVFNMLCASPAPIM